jgi:hypothetical protein
LDGNSKIFGDHLGDLLDDEPDDAVDDDPIFSEGLYTGIGLTYQTQTILTAFAYPGTKMSFRQGELVIFGIGVTKPKGLVLARTARPLTQPAHKKAIQRDDNSDDDDEDEPVGVDANGWIWATHSQKNMTEEEVAKWLEKCKQPV